MKIALIVDSKENTPTTLQIKTDLHEYDITIDCEDMRDIFQIGVDSMRVSHEHDYDIGLFKTIAHISYKITGLV